VLIDSTILPIALIKKTEQNEITDNHRTALFAVNAKAKMLNPNVKAIKTIRMIIESLKSNPIVFPPLKLFRIP